MRRQLTVVALFVFIGARPGADWLADSLAPDERGAIPTGRDIQGGGADPQEARWRHLPRPHSTTSRKIPL